MKKLRQFHPMYKRMKELKEQLAQPDSPEK